MSKQLSARVKTMFGFAPANYTGAAVESDIFSMKNFNRAKITIVTGAIAGGLGALTLKQCQDVADTGVKALGFDWMTTNKAAADTPVKTAVTSDTFLLDTANSIWTIELQAEELDVKNGFDCFHVNVASPGANDDFYACIVELYDGASIEATSLTD